MYFLNNKTVIPTGSYDDIYTEIAAFVICEEKEEKKLWTYHFLNIDESIELTTTAREVQIPFRPEPIVFDNYNLIVPVQTKYYQSENMPEFEYNGEKIKLRLDNFLMYISPKYLLEKSVTYLQKNQALSYLFTKEKINTIEVINTATKYHFNSTLDDSGEYLVVNRRIVAHNDSKRKYMSLRKFLYFIYFRLPIKQVRQLLILWHLDQIIYRIFDDVDNSPYIDAVLARKTCFKEELE